MEILDYHSIPEQDAGTGSSGATIRWIIDDKTGAPNFAMRILEFEPGGYSPRHSHDWEHEVFILEGQGETFSPQGDRPVKAGDAIFVPGGEEHQFKNTGSGVMRMLCLVPLAKD